MRKVRKVRLVAQDGAVKFKGEMPNHDYSKAPACEYPPGGYNTVFSLSDSQDVVIKGFTIENEFVGGDYRTHLECGGGVAASNAALVANSRNVRFEDMNIASRGKNTIKLQSSNVIIRGGSITGVVLP